MKLSSIEGIITLEDGSESKFRIGSGFGWSQWGASMERLGLSVDIVDALVDGLQENDIPTEGEDGW